MQTPFVNTTANSYTTTWIPNPTDTYSLPTAVYVLKTMLLALFFLIGFTGNTALCIIIVRNHDTRTRTNIFYFNLAIANLGQALICIPFTLITLLTGEWMLGTKLCYVNGISNSFWISACTFSVTATTIHKYFSIVNPLRRVLTKRKVYLMLFVVWLASGLVCILPILRYRNIIYKPTSGQCGFNSSRNHHDKYQLLILALSIFIVPTLINIFCYVRMFKALSEHSRRIMRSSIIDESGIRAQRRHLITLYVIFIVFLVTWLPFDIYSMFFIFGKEELLPDWFLAFVYMCAYSTSAQVPLIIILRSNRLKGELKLLMKKLFCCLLHNGNNQSRIMPDKQNNISFKDIDLDRRCSGWYIAGHRPVLELTEMGNKEHVQNETDRFHRLLSIETYL